MCVQHVVQTQTCPVTQTDFLALNGSLTVVPLCFLLPCVMYVRYVGKENVTRPQLAIMGTIVAVMSVVAVFGVISSVRQIALDASTYQLFS